MVNIPWYFAFGKINDENGEFGKQCFMIAPSIDEFRKLAKKNGVYEINPGDEIEGALLITYRGDGHALRIWGDKKRDKKTLIANAGDVP